MRRIRFIDPVVGATQEDFAGFISSIRDYAAVGTDLSIVGLREGPTSIEAELDAARAIPGILELVKETEELGFDAVVINCFDDPGLRASRELVGIPVLGPGECALRLAALLGDRIAVLSVGRRTVERLIPRRIRCLGLDGSFASLRRIGLGVLDLKKNPEEAEAALRDCAKQAQDEDGADVLVLGCTGMTRFAASLYHAVRIPVVSPAIAALKTAETLLDMGF